MRRFIVLICGIVAVCALATWWLIVDNRPDPVVPTQTERIIDFCSKQANHNSPICTIENPTDEDAGDVVERIVERRNDGPTIIERESNDDDDDNSDSPQVNVTVPRERTSSTTPTPRATPSPTQSPLVEIPEVIPDLGLPLLP